MTQSSQDAWRRRSCSCSRRRSSRRWPTRSASGSSSGWCGQDHTVQELQEALQLSQPVVSQQLAVLRAHNVVSGAKSGTTVSYAVRDPLIGDLLDVARRIFNNHLVGTQDLLKTLQRERRGR